MRSTAALFALTLGWAAASDWPHWRGETRDGRSAESSRFDGGDWLQGGPLWGAEVGRGSGSVVISAGKLYAMGHATGRETVWCLDAASGRELWRRSYPAPRYGRHAIGDQGFYGGPSSTPEVDVEGGRLYTMGIDGDLRCWDTAAGGAAVWAINLYEAFGIPQRPQVTGAWRQSPRLWLPDITAGVRGLAVGGGRGSGARKPALLRQGVWRDAVGF